MKPSFKQYQIFQQFIIQTDNPD